MRLLLAVVVLLAGCRDVRKEEAPRVVAAVDAVVAADGPGKATAVEALRKVPCTDAAIRGVRDRCALAFDRMVEATRAQQRAREALKREPPATAEAEKEIRLADQLLEGAKGPIDTCVTEKAQLATGRVPGGS